VDKLKLFDDRLEKLELSILPIHEATQDLAKTQSNVNKSLAGLKKIIGYFDLVAAEEEVLLKGPERKLTPYLQSMDRMREVAQYMSKSRLRSCEKTMRQVNQILKASMQHLRDRFKKLLESVILEPTKELLQLSAYLAQADAELDFSSGYTKVYSDVRMKSLQNSIQSLTHKDTGDDMAGFQQGVNDFFKLVEKLVAVSHAERELMEQLIPEHELDKVWITSTVPMFELFVGTVEALIKQAKRNLTASIFDIIEMHNHLRTQEAELNQIFEVFCISLP
jgi:hypothetical protein